MEVDAMLFRLALRSDEARLRYCAKMVRCAICVDEKIYPQGHVLAQESTNDCKHFGNGNVIHNNKLGNCSRLLLPQNWLYCDVLNSCQHLRKSNSCLVKIG